MSEALSVNGHVFASDACASLIALYQAVRAGWEPPTDVSREEHAAARNLPDSDPRKALIGFGSSFGGSYFASYASGFNGPLTYAQLAARNVKRAAPVPTDVFWCDFLAEEPFDSGFVLYLDPPYRGTAGYKAIGAFDTEMFDARVLQWAKFGPVFVSEYSFPHGKEVWSRTSKGTFGLKSGKVHTERLFLVGG